MRGIYRNGERKRKIQIVERKMVEWERWWKGIEREREPDRDGRVDREREVAVVWA